MQKRSPGEWFKIVSELSKIHISQLVTLSTATGFLLTAGRLSWDILIPMLGVFLLACGAAALNEVQEHRADALMPRTRKRPIPSGRLGVRSAFLIALLQIAAGAAVLFFGTNITAFTLGLLTALWYNGVYTYLKRFTPWAVVPGALIGSLPPLIGWASAGGDIFSPPAMLVALFFFIWQIPHFWLLLLTFGQDYRKAGYPTLTTIFNSGQLGRLTFTWIIATAISILLVPLFGLGNSYWVYLLLLFVSSGLIWNSLKLLSRDVKNVSFRRAFHGINIYILLVMFLLSIDRLL